MSDGKIKLSELRAVRAAMTPGPFSHFERDGRIEAPGVNEYLPKTICEMFIANHDANGRGIVATHNAADALIELAEADMAYREASRVRAKAGARWRIASGIVARGNTAKTTNQSLDERAAYAEYQRAEDAVLRAHDRLDAARAKFEP